jgi:hypothetical protein
MNSIFLSGYPMLTVVRFAKAEELARKEVCSPFFPFIFSIKRVISDLSLLNRGKNGKRERYCPFSRLLARMK